MTELQVLKDNIRVLLKLEYGNGIFMINDWELLYYLCINNKVELVEDLVHEGFDLNIKNKYGNTILIYASWNPSRNLEIAKMLLELGADPNIKNNYGGTAILYVTFNNNPEMFKLLKKYGAKKLVNSRYLKIISGYFLS